MEEPTTVRVFALLILLSIVLTATGALAQEAAADSTTVAEIKPGKLELLDQSLDELTRLGSTIDSLLAGRRGLHGEERELLRIEILEQASDLEEVSEQVASQIGDLPDAQADSIRTAAESVLRHAPELYLWALDYGDEQLGEVRSRRDRAELAEMATIELEISTQNERIDDLLDRSLTSLQRLDRIGLDTEDLDSTFDSFLGSRAQSLANRLQIGLADRRRLREVSSTIGPANDNERVAGLELRLIEQRVDALVRSLRITTDYMSRRDLDSANFDALIIEATGSITEEILNPDVFKKLAADSWRNALRWLHFNGPTLVVWMFLLGLTILLTRLFMWAAWQVIRTITRPPKLLQNLIAGLLRPASSVIGLIIGLWILGVNPTTLLAGIGVLSVIIGLALQDSLGNIAAGVFILLYRPYDVDEIVQAGGVVGRVREMGLANTTIVTFDRRRLFVPNKKIWSEVIENRSAEPLRRIEATVRISYDEDVDATIAYLSEVMREHELVLGNPAPEVFLSRLDDAWVELSVWPWTLVEHWWYMETNLARILRLALDEKGIAHAFPMYEVRGAQEIQASHHDSRIVPPPPPAAE